MEKQQIKKPMGIRISSMLNNPTPRLIRILMAAMTAIGISQGTYAFLKVGVPALNAIFIGLIPALGGALVLYLIIPLLMRLEKKKDEATSVSSAYYASCKSGSILAAAIIGIPSLFLVSQSFGLPFHGMCQKLLLPHWYHFVLAGVLGVIYSCNVNYNRARSSNSVSKSASIVLQTR